MSNRQAITIMAFLLLLEAFAQSLKHPLLLLFGNYIYAFSPIVADIIQEYYNNFAPFIRLVLYTIYTMYIVQFGATHPRCSFAKYFVYDLGMLLINVIYLFFLPEESVVRLFAKLVLELGAMTTALLCAHAIYRDIHRDYILPVRNGYRLLAMRHFIYTIIITFTIVMRNYGKVTSIEIQSVKYFFTMWILLMPLLIFSHYKIFVGFNNFRKHRMAKSKHSHHGDSDFSMNKGGLLEEL